MNHLHKFRLRGIDHILSVEEHADSPDDVFEISYGGKWWWWHFRILSFLLIIAKSPEGFKVWKIEKRRLSLRNRRQLINWAHPLYAWDGCISKLTMKLNSWSIRDTHVIHRPSGNDFNSSTNGFGIINTFPCRAWILKDSFLGCSGYRRI